MLYHVKVWFIKRNCLSRFAYYFIHFITCIDLLIPLKQNRNLTDLIKESNKGVLLKGVFISKLLLVAW